MLQEEVHITAKYGNQAPALILQIALKAPWTPSSQSAFHRTPWGDGVEYFLQIHSHMDWRTELPQTLEHPEEFVEPELFIKNL